MDDGACFGSVSLVRGWFKILALSKGKKLGRWMVGGEQTILKLNRDRFVRAFHEESTMEIGLVKLPRGRLAGWRLEKRAQLVPIRSLGV